jgi:DNA primase
MSESPKYLIHAEVRANGVVERSDVVGAIFGQTEGLLGDELDLRDLQESSKVGRIDVDIESEDGRTYGAFTIASGLDRVETAVLAAALETIERVGPCRAECTVTRIEDARSAKRREVIDRATELLTEFEEAEMTGDALISEVRKQARVAELTDFEGLPAGPRVADSDAIIVVEGRADVRQLLEYGIRNAIAVEGTDIPDAVARLTFERKTTAFLDGDRGGDLILRELEQVGDPDYVAFAPAERSVEDLDRHAVTTALRKKIPYEQYRERGSSDEAVAPTDGGTVAPDPEDGPAEHPAQPTQPDSPATQEVDQSLPDATDGDSAAVASSDASAADTSTVESDHTDGSSEDGRQDDMSADGTDAPAQSDVTPDPVTDSPAPEPADESTDESAGLDASETDESPAKPAAETLAAHVTEIIDDGSEQARLVDEEFSSIADCSAAEAFDTVAEAADVPQTIVIDGPVTQRLLDIAAQRGIGQIIGTAAGDFVKQPTSVRVRTADDF